ncbi:CASP-like protein 2B1, partial [Tanacetum coccineum]
FFVVANGIVAAYSLVQTLRCVVSMVRGSVLFNKPLAWLIFSGDQGPALTLWPALRYRECEIDDGVGGQVDTPTPR